MILQKKEIQNYTLTEVENHLRGALEMVEACEPADDLRVAFFNQAVSLLSGKQIIVEDMQATPNGIRLG